DPTPPKAPGPLSLTLFTIFSSLVALTRGSSLFRIASLPFKPDCQGSNAGPRPPRIVTPVQLKVSVWRNIWREFMRDKTLVQSMGKRILFGKDGSRLETR